jgi:hypothetical protein
MPETPTFASKAVAAANNAESSAQNSHVISGEYALENKRLGEGLTCPCVQA